MTGSINDEAARIRMTRRRWIADEVSGSRAALVGAHAQHLAQVLRGRVGQEFDIATGDAVRRGRIISIAADRVEFELGEVVPRIIPFSKACLAPSRCQKLVPI